MKIVLLRHGEPNVPTTGRILADELARWIDIYNASGIKPESYPSIEVLCIARDCNAVVCSDLPRCIESAATLGVVSQYIDPEFRELCLPHGHFPWLRLTAQIWAICFRLLWFLGYSSQCESFAQARRRAENAAHRLEEIAAHQGSVLLLGHGMLNRYIARALIKQGWSGSKYPSDEYWGCDVYENLRVFS